MSENIRKTYRKPAFVKRQMLSAIVAGSATGK
jgi:hypothetical protein